MALKNLFDMVKADRYTADGREVISKAQEAETEDKVYNIGDISQKTGLQKTANGWVKPKNGKQSGAASKHDTDPQTYIVKNNDELRKMYQNEKDPAKKAAMKKALQKQASMMKSESFAPGEGPGRDRPALKKEDHIKLAKEVLSNTSATDPGWTAEEIAKEWKLGKADAEEVKKEFDNLRKGSSGNKPAAKNDTEKSKMVRSNSTTFNNLAKKGNVVTQKKGNTMYDIVKIDGKPVAYFNHESKKVRVDEKYLQNAGAESKPDAANQHDQIGGEIKGNLEAAKYYFDKAQSFSPTDPSYKTYMTKAKQYNDKAKAQADDNGFDFEEMHNSGITQAVNTYAQENQDAAPRVLTGDTRIRVRKETKDRTYTATSINGPREKLENL